MTATVRLCASCKEPLTKARTVKGFKRHVSCESAFKKEQKQKAHDRRVVDTYGLRPGEYLMLYDAQYGKCAICQRATGRTKKLSVDHDHKLADARKSVRGLLCSTCNRMVGHSRDDPEFFERAAAYLRNPPARSVLGTDR